MLLALKLILTPLLIAGTTLATRRWGPSVGGWLVGLPLTSGPISIFLALEQGPDFAAMAAHSTLLSVITVLAFCVAYAKSARLFSWPAATASAFCLYSAAIMILSRVTIPLAASVFLVVALILAAAWAVKPVNVALPKLAAPRWDLPFRMVMATAVLLTITSVSSRLGPQLSGIFSAFPVFICVMSIFSHTLYGAAAVQQFQRGVIVGSFAFASFFLVVALAVQHWNILAVYLAACVAAMGVNLMALTYIVGQARK